jgi:hypothetical protein
MMVLKLLAHFVATRLSLSLTLISVFDSAGTVSRKTFAGPWTSRIDSGTLPRPLTGSGTLACLWILQEGSRGTTCSNCGARSC